MTLSVVRTTLFRLVTLHFLALQLRSIGVIGQADYRDKLIIINRVIETNDLVINE